ncbi:hypothetical protein QA596_05175 [Balneolales bacterium ANBcel1]|nr:hypothetical protein [Balneolales bacterium ANBcel1]
MTQANQDRIAKLKAFLQEDPDDSFSRFALALEYQKTGDHQTARSLFEHIRDKDPGYIGVYYHLGKLYQMTDEPRLALKTYTNGITIARNAGDHHAATELEQALQELEYDAP